MKTDREFDLLADIAKLLNKYGPETFEALADSLASPATTQNLVEVLQTTARVSRTAHDSEHKVRRSRATRPIFDELASIEAAEPEKHALLSTFYHALQAKSVLPTFREMKTFVSDNTLPEIKADSRQRAISPLIRSLMSLPIDELKFVLDGLQYYSRSDNGLQGWSKIILGRDQSTGPT